MDLNCANDERRTEKQTSMTKSTGINIDFRMGVGGGGAVMIIGLFQKI